MRRYQENLKKVDRDKTYSLDEGLKLVLETATARFDEAIDVAVQLGVDAKQSDQQVRGACSMPHGLGKPVRVLVFAKGDSEEEARKAGADFTGAGDLCDKIRGGWLEFDRVIATPDMMPTVAKVAKILGPKGLMPNPKSGTVTPKVGEAVKSEKKGKANFRVDKAGILHTSIGRKSLGFESLKENYLAFTQEVSNLKPRTCKGVYIQKIALSSTMGLGVSIKPTHIGGESS